MNQETLMFGPNNFYELTTKKLGREVFDPSYMTSRFEGVGNDPDTGWCSVDRDAMRLQLLAEVLGLTDPC